MSYFEVFKETLLHNADFFLGVGLGLFIALIAEVIRDIINLAAWRHQPITQPTQEKEERKQPKKERKEEGSNEVAGKREREPPKL